MLPQGKVGCREARPPRRAADPSCLIQRLARVARRASGNDRGALRAKAATSFAAEKATENQSSATKMQSKL